MKRLFVSLLMMIMWGGLTAVARQSSKPPNAQTTKRPKVALVLSGGGAKGMAHIGALKVIERAGIPIDIIAGTSMGSIVGGLYATGKDAQTLDSLVRTLDWGYVLSDREDLSHQSLHERKKQNTYIYMRGIGLRKQPTATGGGFVQGKNIGGLFQKLTSPYTDSIDFNQLPIPFACVATNMVDNTEYVFHSGVLSQAMRASMSIPGAFSPVRMGDMVLVDGGLRNNFPVDVAKEMGADIVIGVSVQEKLRTANELNSTVSILLQLIDANCKNKYDENVGMTDVPIMVDVHGYSAASFNKAAIDTLIRRGEEAAMSQWDRLVEVKSRLDSLSTTPLNHQTTKHLNHQTTKHLNHQTTNPLNHRIKDVRYENMTKMDALFLRSKYKLNVGDSIDDNKASLVTTTIRRDLFYKEASYRFDVQFPTSDAVVIFTANTQKGSQLNVGLRFDNEEMVAMQANAAISLGTKVPGQADVTLRLGKRILAKANLAFFPWSYVRPSLSYEFRHNDINIYSEGIKSHNMTYNQHTADLKLLNFDVRNFNFSLGASWDYYHYNNLLVNYRPELQIDLMANAHYYTYYAQVEFNSEDNWNFPTIGSKFRAYYSYVTDDLIHLNHSVGMRQYSLMWRTSLPVGSRLALRPVFYSRFVYGNNIPGILKNMIGGPFFSHYVSQQLPFPGVKYIEEVRDKFLAVKLQAQLKITKSSIFLADFAAAQDSPTVNRLLNYRTRLGGSLSYYYNTMFGPLGGSVGYSNISRDFYYYVNLGYQF